jgi:Ca-activated chloride channel family protein
MFGIRRFGPCVWALVQFTTAGLAFQAQPAEGPIEIAPRVPPGTARPSQNVQAARLRVDSSLVLIPVHVTNALGASVTNLIKENFEILEDGVPQTISQFAKDDAPVSIGLLFDASGSMRNKRAKVAEAVSAFFKTTNPEDEFFLIEFNDRPKLAVPFTHDVNEVKAATARAKPFGRTSLLDALHMGIVQMKKAHNFRKALVLLSDGGDNASSHSVRQINYALAESDAQLYAIGIFDANYATRHPPEERAGPNLLTQLAAQTGGRHFPVTNLDDLPAISARIARELHNQYLIGYTPANPARDGKYRRVKLKLKVPSGANGLHVYYRQGYYAVQ